MTDTIATDTGRPARAGRRRAPAAPLAEIPAAPAAAPEFPPVSNYAAVRVDWDPAAAPWNTWNRRTLVQAEADLAYHRAIGAAEGEYVLVRVDTTVTVVGGGKDA